MRVLLYFNKKFAHIQPLVALTPIAIGGRGSVHFVVAREHQLGPIAPSLMMTLASVNRLASF
jgi:hypothetical protein